MTTFSEWMWSAEQKKYYCAIYEHGKLLLFDLFDRLTYTLGNQITAYKWDSGHVVPVPQQSTHVASNNSGTPATSALEDIHRPTYTPPRRSAATQPSKKEVRPLMPQDELTCSFQDLYEACRDLNGGWTSRHRHSGSFDRHRCPTSELDQAYTRR